MKSLTLFETEQGESSQLFLGCEIDKKKWFITENLALTSILRHNVKHVFCFHHLEKKSKKFNQSTL